MDYVFHYNSPLGGITLASDGSALTGLWFDGQKYFAQGLDPEHEEKELPVFDVCIRWLDIYFSGKDPGFTPPLSIRATEYRRLVFEILLSIPYGKTMTYKQVAWAAAQMLGVKNMSAQAAGSAVGHNPISIIIPCHRVIASDGSLKGYAGGLDKKLRLLTLEKAEL